MEKLRHILKLELGKYIFIDYKIVYQEFLCISMIEK